MPRLVLTSLIALSCVASARNPVDLSFAAEKPGDFPLAWGGAPRETIFADNQILHGDPWSVRIERAPESKGQFSTITKSLPIDFGGHEIELSGYLRTENVTGFVGLWMREDGDSSGLAFDNMQARNLKGTTDWAEYSIKLPVRPEAKELFLGVLLSGTGKAWASSLKLLIDGKPLAEAPQAIGQETILDTDHQFDAGSGVTLVSLTKVQVENLATLCKVWGYLKYHHPTATSGQRQWDYELFRVIPQVLAARDREAANTALVHWIDGLGPVPKCQPCATLDETDLQLAPDLDWIKDTSSLGAALSESLQLIFANRTTSKQFYVSLVHGVGNPDFSRELSYQKVKLPDAGFQLLALYRLWNIVRYWAPYRQLTGEDWDSVLKEFIPKIALAGDREGYTRELFALVAEIRDSHANLWGSFDDRPPVGECQIPIDLRFVSKHLVVARLNSESSVTGLQPGDEVTSLDGVLISDLVAKLEPYYAASNEPKRLRDIAQEITRGHCGTMRVNLVRGNESRELTVDRVHWSDKTGLFRTHDLPGDTYRRLSDDVAYLKLSSVKIADVGNYISGAARTKGLIIDIRNYPSEFMVFALGSRLIDKPNEFVRFTQGDLNNPGAFHWTKPISISPGAPGYRGKVVILIDESTMSQAEYTTMALRTDPNAVVVGSTTAGADGNVSGIPLPGGLQCAISGIGVFYPDKRPTQQIGIVPDITVLPTINGIRDGRDEVLEQALRVILGPDVPVAEIEKLARPDP